MFKIIPQSVSSSHKSRKSFYKYSATVKMSEKKTTTSNDYRESIWCDIAELHEAPARA